MLGTPIANGFTYDQQSEPTGTLIAGQTWRERSAGGLIVGEWEWSGSNWWSRLTELGGTSVSNAATNTFPTFNAIELNASPLFVDVVCRFYLTTADASNRWDVGLRRLGESGSSLTNGNISGTSVSLITGLGDWQDRTFTNLLTVGVAGRGLLNAMSVIRVGTPANLTATFSLRYRRIR